MKNWVDGLRSTTADPYLLLPSKNGGLIPALPLAAEDWPYRQTGFIMEPFDSDGYMHEKRTHSPSPHVGPQADQSLHRSLTTTTLHPFQIDQIRADGFRYVWQEHQWPRIARRFYQPLVTFAQKRYALKASRRDVLEITSANRDRFA